MDRYYAGIGSRKTPVDVCNAMTLIAHDMDRLGFTLRSGAAIGADQAFEQGAIKKQIFLPWKGYEGSKSEFIEPTEEAIAICRKFFNHFPGVSRGTRMLLSRNMHQVLGPDVGASPNSELIICWTEDGKATGGSKYAIKVAKHFDIPIFNLYNDIDRIKLKIFMDDLKENQLTSD